MEVKVKHHPAVPTHPASEQLASCTSRSGSSDLCERVRVHDPIVWAPRDTPVLPMPALNSPSCKMANSPFMLSLQVWPGATITVSLPPATQKISYAIEVSQQVPEDFLLLGSAHSSYTTSCSLDICCRESQRQARDPLVDWDVGRERKILVLIKDRRMTVFCLTDYDRYWKFWVCTGRSGKETIPQQKAQPYGQSIQMDLRRFWSGSQLCYHFPQNGWGIALHMAHLTSSFSKRGQSFWSTCKNGLFTGFLESS